MITVRWRVRMQSQYYANCIWFMGSLKHLALLMHLLVVYVIICGEGWICHAQEERATLLLENIEKKQWGELVNFADVEEVELTQIPIRSSELKHLQSLSALKKLSLRSSSYKHGTLFGGNAIASLPDGIKELDLHGDNLSTSAVAHFSHLRKLTHLDLQGTNIGRDGDADFSFLPALTHLRLGIVTSETVLSCSRIPTLESLVVSLDRYDEGVIEELGKLPSLKHLEIGGFWMPCSALEYAKRLPLYSKGERELFAAVRTIHNVPMIYSREFEIIQKADPTFSGLNQHLKKATLKLAEKVDKQRAAARALAEKEYGSESSTLVDVDRWLCLYSGGLELLGEMTQQPTTDPNIWVGCPTDHRFRMDSPTAGCAELQSLKFSLRVTSSKLREGEDAKDRIRTLMFHSPSFVEDDEVNEYRRRQIVFRGQPALETKSVTWFRRGEMPVTELSRTVIIGDRVVEMTVSSIYDISDQAAYQWFDSVEVR